MNDNKATKKNEKLIAAHLDTRQCHPHHNIDEEGLTDTWKCRIQSSNWKIGIQKRHNTDNWTTKKKKTTNKRAKKGT